MNEERLLLGLALTTTAIASTFLLAKKRKDESVTGAAELSIPSADSTLNNDAASTMAPPNDARNISPRPLRRTFSEGKHTCISVFTHIYFQR